jgi:enoyl-CoA hydratase
MLMTEDIVLCDVDDAIATITVNRPDRYNALNVKIKETLLKKFKEVDEDNSVRVIILTGMGEKAFISGADVTEFVGKNSETIKSIVTPSRDVSSYIDSMKKPVIAALNGYTLGGGCELALACDIRYASANARLGLPEINLGTIPGNGGIVRLPRLVGLGIATEMILTGKLISAEEALRIRLVNKVFDDVDALRNGVHDLAMRIASRPKVAVQLANQTLDKTWRLSFDEHSKYELNSFCQTFDTNDVVEGVRAFMEKRDPEFKHH